MIANSKLNQAPMNSPHKFQDMAKGGLNRVIPHPLPVTTDANNNNVMSTGVGKSGANFRQRKDDQSSFGSSQPAQTLKTGMGTLRSIL